MSAREEAAMGTAMRFITALGGVVLIAFAFGLFGYPIIETIAEPEYADFPGGAAGIVVMLLLMGSVPFGGGVLLIRRAARGGPRAQTITDDWRGRPESSTPAPPAPVADVVESASPIASSIEASAPVQPLQMTRDTEDVLPQRRRRTWLAMLGLAIVLGVFLVDTVIVLGAFSDDSRSRGARSFILVFVVLLSAIPLLGGLRIAVAGDPEVGRRFSSDLRARVGHLRRPIGLVRTSAGLAFVTALVSVPAMIIWRDAAPFIGPFAFDHLLARRSVGEHRSTIVVGRCVRFGRELVRAVSRDGGGDRYRVGPAGRPDRIHPAADGVSGSDGVIWTDAIPAVVGPPLTRRTRRDCPG